LKDIVLPPSLFNKLLSVAGTNFNSKLNPVSAVSGAFSSPIPWRKAGLRYTSNEIYVDLIEELRAVVNRCVPRLPVIYGEADGLRGTGLFCPAS
jgi:AP-3 complex subunit mu